MGKNSKFRKNVASKQVLKNYDRRSSGGLKSSMRSSWVEYYEWIPYNVGGQLGDFFMKVFHGKRYEWKSITKAEAGQAVGGNATCTTDDLTGRLRWWVGKYPSLGAAYHQIVKFFGYGTTPITPATTKMMPAPFAFHPLREAPVSTVAPFAKPKPAKATPNLMVAPFPKPNPYADLTQEFIPKYNVSDFKPKPGRPKKADVFARDFAALGRYRKPRATRAGGTP
jgi:hypothetical protein